MLDRATSIAGHTMRILLAPLFALGLAACNQMSTIPVVKPLPTEPPRAAAGPGCEAQIAWFKEILTYDRGVGRVAQSVYDKAIGPLGQAESACAAGRSGEAMGILTRTKRASGYG